MQKIVVMAGSKQSGKSSTCNFLHGHILKKNQQIKFFDIDEKGQLVVNALYEDENGISKEGQGIVDIHRRDYEFSQYAQYHVWPYIKSYNFADKLKWSVVSIFGISPDLVFGDNEAKNTLTHIKYSDVAIAYYPNEIEKMKKNKTFSEYITVRQLLQVFGTRVCRRIQDSCWIDGCVKDIIAEEAPFAVVGDCRFINEIIALRKTGAKVIKFTRKVDDDDDKSETELDNYTDVDCVIDNKNMTIEEKNKAVFEYLSSINYVEGEI